MEKYLDRQALLDQFTDFAARNGVRKNPEGLKISGNGNSYTTESIYRT